MEVCDSQLNTSASGVAALHFRHGEAETSRTLPYCASCTQLSQKTVAKRKNYIKALKVVLNRIWLQLKRLSCGKATHSPCKTSCVLWNRDPKRTQFSCLSEPQTLIASELLGNHLKPQTAFFLAVAGFFKWSGQEFGNSPLESDFCLWCCPCVASSASYSVSLSSLHPITGATAMQSPVQHPQQP